MMSRRANQRRYLCAKFRNDVLLYLRINLDKDSESKHSTTVCCKGCTDYKGHSFTKLDTFPEIAYMTMEFRDFIQEEKLKENLRYLEGIGGTKSRKV